MTDYRRKKLEKGSAGLPDRNSDDVLCFCGEWRVKNYELTVEDASSALTWRPYPRKEQRMSIAEPMMNPMYSRC